MEIIDLQTEITFWEKVVDSAHGSEKIMKREIPIRKGLGVYRKYGRRYDTILDGYVKEGVLELDSDGPEGKNGRWYVVNIPKLKEYLQKQKDRLLAQSQSF